MKIQDYHSDTSRISKSGLDKIDLSPAHYFEHYLSPSREDRQTKPMELGEFFHCAVLELPFLFQRYTVLPEKIDLRKKEGKEMFREYQESDRSKRVIRKPVWDAAARMAEKVRSHPIARQLLSKGQTEQTILFTEPETGAECKCRPDFLNYQNILIDLKSANDASPEGFAKAVRQHRYFVQDPFYSDGLYFSGRPYPEAFIFIVCESEPPHNVALYQLSEADRAYGREVYLENLKTYVKCKRSGRWPGYSPKIETLTIF